MGPGVTPVCLEHLETLLAVLNRANPTYMAATSDYFEKFGTFAKPLKIIIFHALGFQRPKMALDEFH